MIKILFSLCCLKILNTVLGTILAHHITGPLPLKIVLM
jgi:hypothetical protein